jgi:hypothetical protein
VPGRYADDTSRTRERGRTSLAFPDAAVPRTAAHN